MTPLRSLALVSVAVLAGCQGADDAAKRDAAIKRVQNQQGPGFVRAINLSADSLVVKDRGRALTVPVGSGEASRFAPFRSGEHALELQVGSKSTTKQMDMQPDEPVTVVVYPGGSDYLVKGEFRKPIDSANLRVFFLPGADLKSFTLDGPTKVNVTSTTKDAKLAPGDYTCDGASITIEPNYAYSMIVVKVGGKDKVFLLLNTPNEKPVSAGAAAS